MVFSQFRSHYPQGSIITEMLSKVDGLHTFRATIKDNDIILSTATSVDSDLETAEDRAIKRALTILGINFESNYGIQATLMPQSSLKPAIKSTQQFFIEPTSIESSSGYASIDKYQTEEYAQTEEYTPEKYISEKPAVEKYAPENHKKEVPLKPTNSEKLIPEPIDLSNQLSQIMVEMERIGWTKQQGKDYLQRKYKKNSRDQLSASEVIDFLEYLKSQSDTF